METGLIQKVCEKVLAYTKKPYIKPLCTIESLDLKMGQLSNDTLQLSNFSELLNNARKILGRDLEIVKLREVVDVNHTLPNQTWNGTVNCLNENIRLGYISPELKGIMQKIDEIMSAGKKTEYDAIAYRAEGYLANNKHLSKIMNLKPGDKYTDHTYRYITDDLEYANHFGDLRDVRVKYNYILPKGSICIGTCENSCALLPKETVSEILSVNTLNPKEVVINAILRTS